MSKTRVSDDNPESAQRSGQPLDGNWADGMVAIVGVYFCLCGVVALILDGAYAMHIGRFTVVSPYSLAVIKWLYALGLCSALVAYVGYPRRLLSRIFVVILCPVYAVATVVVWFMSLNPPDWTRW